MRLRHLALSTALSFAAIGAQCLAAAQTIRNRLLA